LIEKKVTEMKLETTPALSPGSFESLMAYDWPGNIRELENMIERGLIVNPKGSLNLRSLLHSLASPGKNKKNHSQETFLSLNEVNRIHIEEALALTNGKINGTRGTAELLRIRPNTLRRRMDKLGIQYGRQKRSK